MNQPNSRGSIIIFAGRKTYPHEAAERLRRSLTYLVNVHGIPQQRLILVNGGYRQDLSSLLYVVPPGADLPQLESGVPLSEVQFIKRRRKDRPQKS
jgi:hypothetical protein